MVRWRSVITVGLFLLTCGCASSVSKDWSKATTTDTVDGYKAFLEKHPSSQFAAEAQRALDAKTADEQRALEAKKEHAERVKRNWPLLKRGMSYEEVERLIGPLHKSPEFAEKARSRIAFSREVAEMGAPVSGELSIQHELFDLVFSPIGELEEWVLK